MLGALLYVASNVVYVNNSVDITPLYTRRCRDYCLKSFNYIVIKIFLPQALFLNGIVDRLSETQLLKKGSKTNLSNKLRTKLFCIYSACGYYIFHRITSLNNTTGHRANAVDKATHF